MELFAATGDRETKTHLFCPDEGSCLQQVTGSCEFGQTRVHRVERHRRGLALGEWGDYGRCIYRLGGSVMFPTCLGGRGKRLAYSFRLVPLGDLRAVVLVGHRNTGHVSPLRRTRPLLTTILHFFLGGDDRCTCWCDLVLAVFDC